MATIDPEISIAKAVVKQVLPYFMTFLSQLLSEPL